MSRRSLFTLRGALYSSTAILAIGSLGKSASAETVLTVTQLSYDADRRVECTAVRMDPAQWAAQTDACVPQLNGPDGADRITKNVYDAAGRLAQIRRAYGVAGREQAYVTYSYTPNGLQEYVVDANGNRAQLTYDGFDRKNRWYFPSDTAPPATFDGSTQDSALQTSGAVNIADKFEAYDYDPNGNMKVRTVRNGTQINYTYDNLNRLASKTLPSGNPNLDSTYSYDLLGHLLTMTSTKSPLIYSTATSYVYDGLGRVLSETEDLNGTAHTVSSTYDAAGNRKKITWDSLTSYVTYNYDALNRMTDVNQGDTTNLVHFIYDNDGRRQTLQRSNGTSTVYGYDVLSRLTDLKLMAGTSTVTNEYTFAYTSAGDIKQKTLSNAAFAWTSSVAANRNYTVNGLNEYNGITGLPTPSYDPKGNLTQAGGPTYGYNAENELATEAIGAVTYRFYYDPHHRLLYNTQSNTRLVYDGDYVAAEYGPTNALKGRYVFGPNPDEPLIWYNGSGATDKRWLAADGQGSIVLVTNAAGTSLGTNTYDEYGIPANTFDGSGNITYTNIGRFQYTGQQWISELGMYDYKARFYSPMHGRFMQTDPIGYRDDVNLYSYVGNDPIDASDPSGEQVFGPNAPMYTGLSDATQSSQCSGNATCGLKLWNAGNLEVAKSVGEWAALDLTGLAAFKGISWGWRAYEGYRAERLAAGTLTLASKQAAREALNGPLRTAANRFFRDAAKNAEDFRIESLRGGGKRFQFFSPANNPGYGKLYVQEVDKTGAVIREFKDTLGPEGLIQRKTLHGE